MSNPLAFKYSLTRRGRFVYFKIKEQGSGLYNKALLNEVSAYLRRQGYGVTVLSCNCPELEGDNIYLRGSESELDEESIYLCCWGVEEAIQEYKKYKQVFKHITDFLSTYEGNAVLRKIGELQRRYKNKEFHSKATPLPFPKDI